MSKSKYSPLGQELYKHLKRLRWTQRELARQAGISHGNVSKIIRGEHRPSPDTLNIIGQVINVDPVHLMRLAGIPLPSNKRPPKVEHVAERLTKLPDSVQSAAIDAINAQLDAMATFYDQASTKKEADTLHVSQERLDSEIIEILPPEAIYVVNRVQEHDEAA